MCVCVCEGRGEGRVCVVRIALCVCVLHSVRCVAWDGMGCDGMGWDAVGVGVGCVLLHCMWRVMYFILTCSITFYSDCIQILRLHPSIPPFLLSFFFPPFFLLIFVPLIFSSTPLSHHTPHLLSSSNFLSSSHLPCPFFSLPCPPLPLPLPILSTSPKSVRTYVLSGSEV